MHTRKVAIAVAAVLVVALFVVFRWNGHIGTRNVLVTVFDIGQGDAILIRTPNGSDILIDGGPPNGGIVEKLGSALPPADRDLELVIVTHPDADHVGGLPSVAARYRIDRVIDNGSTGTSVFYARWLDEVKSQGSERIIGRVGTTVVLDDVVFDVVWPDADTDVNGTDRNDASVVARVRYGNVSFLFTGDITAKVEDRLLATHTTITADVLKVAHHGSAYSSSNAFLDAVHPSYALISVGAGNRYGHPHGVVLKRLTERGVEVFRTDEVGDVSVVSDGRNVTFDY